MSKYDNIINLNPPEPIGGMSMSLNDRAKIFGSFMPLKGYEDQIEEKSRIRTYQRELSDDEITSLNNTLNTLKEELAVRNHPMLKVTYYKHEDDMGTYQTIEGILSKIDEYERYIQIVNKKISFRDLDNIIINSQ